MAKTEKGHGNAVIVCDVKQSKVKQLSRFHVSFWLSHILFH